MFKLYLEALTDIGKAKMNILDKSSLLKRKKNWQDIGARKPKEKIKLVVNPTPQQLKSFGWIVPEWSKSDAYVPGENIGFVRGIIYYDKFIDRIALTIADTSEGNEIIHEHILEELQRLGRLEKTEPLGAEDWYDDDIDHYLCVIQDGTKMEFDLSESYSQDMNGDPDSQEWIDLYKRAGGQYKINNHLSKMYTNDLMDEVDGWGPPSEDEIDRVSDLMVKYIYEDDENILQKLLDKYPNDKNKRITELSDILMEKYSGMLDVEDLEEAIYDAFGKLTNHRAQVLADLFKQFMDYDNE